MIDKAFLAGASWNRTKMLQCRFACRDNEMALNIRNPEAERLAAELAQQTGETKTEAVAQALRERLARIRRDQHTRTLTDELESIAQRCAELPVLDDRAFDAILGYDDTGLPS